MSSIPTLTTAQIFSNQCNSVITFIANCLNGNINRLPTTPNSPNPQLNLAAIYVNCHQTLFSNPNNTTGNNDIVAINLSTEAESVLAFLTWLYNGLISFGVTGLPALPTYTAHDDGTVNF